jgi:hypothetical protein
MKERPSAIERAKDTTTYAGDANLEISSHSQRDRLGMHTCYFDGYPRPLCRGWIHLAEATVLLVASIWCIARPPFRRHESTLAIALFLGCKAVVYAASAAFHLVHWRSARSLRWINIADVALIPGAVYSQFASIHAKSSPLSYNINGAPFCPHAAHAVRVSIFGGIAPFAAAGTALPAALGGGLRGEAWLGGAALLLNGAGVAWQFGAGGSANARSAVVMLYYGYNEVCWC